MSTPTKPAAQHRAPLLSQQETAIILKNSTRTVRRLIQRGELPAARIGGLIRIEASDVENFLRRSRM